MFLNAILDGALIWFAAGARANQERFQPELSENCQYDGRPPAGCQDYLRPAHGGQSSMSSDSLVAT